MRKYCLLVTAAGYLILDWKRENGRDWWRMIVRKRLMEINWKIER
jgi:hypothetical protein